jgi:hypothetical protein
VSEIVHTTIPERVEPLARLQDAANRACAEIDKLRRALRELREEILDEIDGAEESRGRDAMLSRFIDIIDRALP